MTEQANNVENVEEVIEETTAVTEEDVQVEAETNEEVVEAETVDPVEQLMQEKQQLEDRVLRLQAEIANMQRINTKERQDAAKFRSQKLATSLLEVVDNLERALETETNSEDAAALKKGVEMVASQLKTAFEREEIKVINPLGEPFDPNYHQAISVQPTTDGQASDIVLNVLQVGYQLHERVLRPAMVIVSQ